MEGRAADERISAPRLSSSRRDIPARRGFMMPKDTLSAGHVNAFGNNAFGNNTRSATQAKLASSFVPPRDRGLSGLGSVGLRAAEAERERPFAGGIRDGHEGRAAVPADSGGGR